MSAVISDIVAEKRSTKTNDRSRMVKAYNKVIDVLAGDNYLREQYSTRNKPEVVNPFLKGMGLQYFHVESSNTIVVCETTGYLTERLKELGFLSVYEVFPNTDHFMKAFAVTEVLTANRFYQQEFNIELIVVDQKQWERLMLAKEAIDDLVNGKLVKKIDYLSALMVNYGTRLRQRTN